MAEQIDEHIEVAKSRSRALIAFIEKQVKQMGSTEPSEAYLAAGKVMELVNDHGRADDLYSAAAQGSKSVEPHARSLINKSKAGVPGATLRAEAERVLKGHEDQTYPNLITEEPMSVALLEAHVQIQAGNAEAASHLAEKARTIGDRFAAAGVGQKSADLPQFVKLGTVLFGGRGRLDSRL